MGEVPIATVRPPFNAPPVGDDGQYTEAWTKYFQALADQINAMQAALAASNAFWAALAAGPSYANDAAAAAGLVPVGVRYRNGSIVMVRIA
jgi:hypothetical protein